MRFSTEQTDAALTVKICGEIDQHCAAEIRADIDREIDIRNINELVFDLEGVTFMDSSGLGMIMGRYKKLKLLGGRVRIVGAKPQVDKVLELSGIKKLLNEDCRNAEVSENE